MDDNITKAIFNLMQNVVDKSDAILETLSKKKQVNFIDIVSKNTKKLNDHLTIVTKNQSIISENNSAIETKIIECIENNRIQPTVNNFIEYSLIGKDPSIKPKYLLLIIFGIIITWCSIKYLPSYFSNESELNRDKKNYQLFYNYVFLTQFAKSEHTTADKVLEKIEQNDTIFLNEYYLMFETFNKDMRKRELQNELKALENGDR